MLRRRSSPLRASLALTGLLVGLGLGSACAEEEDEYELPLATATACADYCERRAECDDEVDRVRCEDRCTERMGNCRADELDQATDDLNLCAAESCDDVLTCAVASGTRCYFGL